ncbi:41779_t:CDS:2, partial [Gigaspora margarita]
FGITFGVVAKDAVRDPLESPLESPLFHSSNFETREMLLELEHMLLESPFVRDSVIFEIGACAIRVADSVVGIFVRYSD